MKIESSYAQPLTCPADPVFEKTARDGVYFMQLGPFKIELLEMEYRSLREQMNACWPVPTPAPVTPEQKALDQKIANAISEPVGTHRKHVTEQLDKLKPSAERVPLTSEQTAKAQAKLVNATSEQLVKSMHPKDHLPKPSKKAKKAK